jgi:antagonist of KipI
MSLRVLRPGLLTTVQDRGRIGLQHLGVVPGGAMDRVAHALANALVGNSQDAAALEITVLGPELEFEAPALVALCGAEFEARVAGKPFPHDRPVLVEAGTRVSIGRAWRGARAYLSLAGGLPLEPVLGSRSTYLPGRFGGWQGRALARGDVVPFADDTAAVSAARYAKLSRQSVNGELRTVRWSAPSLTLPDRDPIVVHALEGQHHGLFDTASQRAFFDALWRVAPESNRMGYRLAGQPLAPRGEGGRSEVLSGPTCLGTVQVPPSGTPIVLMADHQTTGGYPKFAEVASADVPRLAQLAPGARLHFARCTLEQAVELRQAAKARLDAALRALSWEYSR